MTIFSIGYQGTELPTFIGVLLTYEINMLVDVRLTPWSRKPGFSKTKLSSALQDAGIKYIHLRETGNPKEIREQGSNIEECLALYRDFILADQSGPEALRRLLEEEPEARVCLMCFERSAFECHRSVLLDVIGDFTDHEFIHIDAAEQAAYLE